MLIRRQEAGEWFSRAARSSASQSGWHLWQTHRFIKVGKWAPESKLALSLLEFVCPQERERAREMNLLSILDRAYILDSGALLNVCMCVCASREQTLLDESSSANHKTNKVEYSMANLMCKKISGRARTGRRGERRSGCLLLLLSFPHSQGRVVLFTGPVGLIYSLRPPQPPWQFASEVANFCLHFACCRKITRLCFFHLCTLMTESEST